MMTVPNLFPAAPEIFLLALTSFLLIADLFVPERSRFLTYALAQAGLLGCAVITLLSFHSEPVYTFNGMFVDDVLAQISKIFVYASVSLMLAYSRQYLMLRGMFRGEFFALTLFSTLGMMVMISAHNFVSLYLGLELQALCLYALVALQRDSPVATEAAMKYFVLGALASGLLLYGMSMLYGATGSLDVGEVAAAIQSGASGRTVLVFGLVFLVSGLAFKLGVVPFHMWVPDVYQGAPTAMALFIASAPKLAAFVFFMRLLVSGLQPLVADWQGMLIILAVLSIAIGNITAIAQTNLKRMLAYSAIAHMGFLLLGIIAGGSNGYSSALFYVIAYVLMTLGAFGMIMLLSREGFEADQLDDFKGLNQRSPWYAAVMLILMISMAGLPVSIGFFAKLAVFQAILERGLVWLVVVALLLSLIGAFYYLRLIKLMYMDAPLDAAPLQPSFDVRVLISANGLAVLLFGIVPQPLMAICSYAIRQSL
jgi:NADH-quinone oxidoreductase subunit N